MGRFLHLLVPALLFSSAVENVRADDILPVATAIQKVADGAPWNAQSGNGRTMRMTLNPDGSGTFEGPFTMSISWEIAGDDVCINLRIAGTKCVQFRPIPRGYEGLVDGKVDMTLTR